MLIFIDDTTTVSVVGHFAPAMGDDLGNGRIEQIVFADQTVSGGAEVRSLMQ